MATESWVLDSESHFFTEIHNLHLKMVFYVIWGSQDLSRRLSQVVNMNLGLDIIQNGFINTKKSVLNFLKLVLKRYGPFFGRLYGHFEKFLDQN